MACPNCHLFHHLCKGGCCGPVPIPVKTFEENKTLVQREVKEVIDFGNGTVIPMTEELLCPFLSEDYQCNIYEQRPWVCIKFGDESDPRMTCAFQTKDGKMRHHRERKRVLKKGKNRIGQQIKDMKNEH